MAQDFLSWLETTAYRAISVVSPHLDDAVLSTYALLASAHASQCRVHTLFSRAPGGAPAQWTSQAGFADAEAEFAARRLEDVDAMQTLGIAFEHCDLSPAALCEAAARMMVARWVDSAAVAPGQLLVLLPAGAGRDSLPNWGVRQWHRLMRRPDGAIAHGEHALARDRVHAAAVAAGCGIAWYAEFPYLWNDTPSRVATEISTRAGFALIAREQAVDPAAKLAAISAYRSQLVPLLGDRRSYQLRMLDRPELYLTPSRTQYDAHA